MASYLKIIQISQSNYYPCLVRNLLHMKSLASPFPKVQGAPYCLPVPSALDCLHLQISQAIPKFVMTEKNYSGMKWLEAVWF